MLCSIDPASFPLSKLNEMPFSLGSYVPALAWHCTREPKSLAALYLCTLQLLPAARLPSRLKMTAGLGNHTASNKKWRDRERKRNRPRVGAMPALPVSEVLGVGGIARSHQWGLWRWRRCHFYSGDITRYTQETIR